MRRTYAIPGRETASRIGLPLLGSAAGHVVFLSALSLLGAATGPRGGEAIEVLLVEGATFARSASEGPVSAPAGGAEPLSADGDGAPRAAVPAGHATASQRRPSASPPPRPMPGPSAVPPAGADPIPAPPALSAPSRPAPPAFPAAPGHGEEAEGPVPGATADAVRAGKAAAPVRIGAAGASLTTGEGAAPASAAPSPAGAAVRRGPGPGEAAEPEGGVRVGAAGDGAAGGAESGALVVLRTRIQERIVYPEEAVRRGQEGEVLLRIRIGRSGIPQEIRIARSSGARILDDAARRGVVRASPLPSRPGWVEVPVRFFLR